MSGGWWNSLKEKSAVVLSTVKSDLGEFASTVRDDTKDVLDTAIKKVDTVEEFDVNNPDEAGAGTPSKNEHSAADRAKRVGSKAAEKVERWGESLLAGTAGFFGVAASSDSPQAPLQPTLALAVTDGATPGYSRHRAGVEALIREGDMFLADPSETESYDSWKAENSIESLSETIANLMKDYPSLQTKFASLEVPFSDFWHRLLFRKAALDAVEERRAAIMLRAQVNDEEELGWGDDDDDDDVEVQLDASEEEERAANNADASEHIGAPTPSYGKTVDACTADPAAAVADPSAAVADASAVTDASRVTDVAAASDSAPPAYCSTDAALESQTQSLSLEDVPIDETSGKVSPGEVAPASPASTDGDWKVVGAEMTDENYFSKDERPSTQEGKPDSTQRTSRDGDAESSEVRVSKMVTEATVEPSCPVSGGQDGADSAAVAENVAENNVGENVAENDDDWSAWE